MCSQVRLRSNEPLDGDPAASFRREVARRSADSAADVEHMEARGDSRQCRELVGRVAAAGVEFVVPLDADVELS